MTAHFETAWSAVSKRIHEESTEVLVEASERLANLCHDPDQLESWQLLLMSLQLMLDVQLADRARAEIEAVETAWAFEAIVARLDERNAW